MFNLKRLAVMVVTMLVLSVCIVSPPEVSGASEAIGVNLIVNNFLNNSQAKALSWVVFDGDKPSKNNVDNVVFKWFNPAGQLEFTDSVDPDKEAVAWSYYNVTQMGEWYVNVTYLGKSSIWNNKTFDIVPDHWGPGDYHVSRTTLVSFNSTLTIAPGTTVKFDDRKGLGIEGMLIAQGNSSHPIIFTSNLSSPEPGDWTSITFYKSSNDSSVLDHLRIEYSRDGLTLMEASPSVENCTFYNNRDRAIYAELADTTIRNNHIYNDDDTISPTGITSAKSNLTCRS